jgi:pantoate--beta-alanine ligase
MTICHTKEQLNKALDTLPQEEPKALVPTMGALHSGHISLVHQALEYTSHVIVSIFVNPTQFNNPADLKNYPRNVSRDCSMLQEAGVEIIFIPSVEEIYPVQDNRIFSLDGLDSTGEGPYRPGHFNGVAQIVTRLFELTDPDYAFFGEKDFQQLAIIKHISAKEGVKTRIIPCPTIREKDGLAMSSRNQLLTPEQRKAAPLIYKTLSMASEKAKAQNLHSPHELSERVKNEIDSHPLLETEYVQIVDSSTLRLIDDWSDSQQIRMWVAVYAHPVRLIDNIKLK